MERRQYLATIGGTASVVSIAGCSSIGNDESGGPDYEPGDDTEAMITADYFTEGWTGEEAEDNDVGEDDGPEAETSTTREFSNEDETEVAAAGIGITDEPDTAEAIIDDWATANIVQGESVELGDGGERGEVEGFGGVGFFHSNAAILSFAGRQSGLELQPMNGRAYNIAETLLNNLQEL